MNLANDFSTYSSIANYGRHLNTNNEKARAYIGEDTANGAVAIYGLVSESGFQDVGVSNWKHNGGSSHTLTKMYDNNGNL